MANQGNESTRNVQYPAMGWTVPCMNHLMQNASGTPDENHWRRALAREDVERG